MSTWNNRAFQANSHLSFSHWEDTLFRGLNWDSRHPWLIILLCFCTLNRTPQTSHKSLHSILFSAVRRKADVIGQRHYCSAVNNETKTSTHLSGTVIELTYVQNQGGKVRAFMGMNRSGWEMAPGVFHIGGNETALCVLNISHLQEPQTLEHAFTRNVSHPKVLWNLFILIKQNGNTETLKSEGEFGAWNIVSVSEHFIWILVFQTLSNYVSAQRM